MQGRRLADLALRNDLDHVKLVNHSLGHAGSDAVLGALVAAARCAARNGCR